MRYNSSDLTTYRSDVFDCDNFAVCLAADVAQRWVVNGIGMVIDTGAAW